MKKTNVKEKGITLIALVITIVILLILAGIAIASLTGDNGLFARARQARQNTLDAQNKENETLEGYEDAITSTVGVDWEYALTNATKHPDQKTSTAIGVGTDGKAVNMDLWEYTFDDGTNGYGLNDSSSLTTTESANASKGYNGTDFNNIVIPQYISIDEGENWIPVTNLDWTFFNCTELIKIDNLPSTVISMEYTFRGCSSLTTIFDIPENVITLNCTFYDCSSLNYIRTIGNKVEIMTSTFNGCLSLESVPQLPDTVYEMTQTFRECSKLSSVPNIPINATCMVRTFYNCSSLKTVPMIPENVNTMYQTFGLCSSLTGTLIINASITGKEVNGHLDYLYCFSNAATNEDANLILTGSCKILDKLLSTKSENSNIIVK